MIYLSSPYSHKDAACRAYRWQEACKCVAHFTLKGICMISPIVQGHAMMLMGEQLDKLYDMTHNDWMALDLEMLSKCDTMYVLKIDGWKKSKGVQEEIRYADKHGIPVRYITPPYYEPMEKK